MGDVLNAARHAFALDVILNAFDPHPQSGERGFEVMADGAEHHVLFIKQGCDPRLHRIVRGDQPPDILRAARFELGGFIGIARKRIDAAC